MPKIDAGKYETFLEKSLAMTLQKELELEAQAMADQLEVDLRKRVSQLVSKTVINLMSQVSFERQGTDLIIRVQMLKEVGQ
jgi:hypothetical protein